MGVELKISYEKGWKRQENNRFGSILVVNFVDSKTGRELFKYAPRWDDIPKWYSIIWELTKLEKKHAWLYAKK